MSEFTCLVIEEDVTLAASLGAGLPAYGIRAHVATSLDDVPRMLRQWAFDCIVLDIESLGDGYIALLQLLDRKTSAPIVLLSRATEERQLIQDLDCGAADVLTKPVSPRLLAAKLRRLLDLKAVSGDAAQDADHFAVLRIGDLMLNRHSGDARASSSALLLTGNEFDHLWVLAGHRGEVVGRSAMAFATNKPRSPSRALDMIIVKLRKKLAAAGVTSVTIETVRGRGYRLRLVERISAPPAAVALEGRRAEAVLP